MVGNKVMLDMSNQIPFDVYKIVFLFHNCLSSVKQKVTDPNILAMVMYLCCIN